MIYVKLISLDTYTKKQMKVNPRPKRRLGKRIQASKLYS